MDPQGRQNFGQRLLNAILCASNDPAAPKKSLGRKCVDCLKPSSDEPVNPEGDDGPARETWGNRFTFFISTLGMSVGLGQVWRFPTLAYRQGGGAFLIIYGIMIFLFGNALFFFEVSNGQYTSKNPWNVYDKVPLFQGIGWSMIVYAYLFCTYYTHMVSFSIYYLYRCFTYNLPWTYCPEDDPSHPDKYSCLPYGQYKYGTEGIICGGELISFDPELCTTDPDLKDVHQHCCAFLSLTGDECKKAFDAAKLCGKKEYPSEYFWSHSVNMLHREGDPDYYSLGHPIPWLVCSSFIAWLLAYLTLYKGIKSLGVIMYIMVPLPYIVLFIMLGVIIPQEGSTYGLKEFFTPQLHSFYDITVWRVATEQAFYSIGVAMGPLITFGSYSKFNSPSHIDGSLICLCIFLTSVLCSMVVFSVLGFLSKKTGRSFYNVVASGPGLVFIVYPESLELLPASQFFSALFYIMLINLGLSSVTGIIETVPSAVYDIWPKTRKYKYLINLGVLTSCFLLGLPITCRGGLNVYNTVDTYAAGMTLIPICALELLIIVIFYGLGRFCEDISYMLGFYPNRYWRYQWLLGPFILAAVFIYGVVTFKAPDLPKWLILVGWFLFALIMIQIIIAMIWKIIVYKKADNLKNITKPPSDHGPKKESDRAGRDEFTSARKIW